MEHIQLRGNIFAEINARYFLLTDEYFFGYGNQPDLDNKTNYSHEQAAVGFSLGIKLGNKISAKTQLGFERNNIRSGRNVSLPLTIALHFDGKDHQGRPKSGSEIVARGGLSSSFGGKDFGFSKFSLDASHYLRFFVDRIFSISIATAQ